MSRFSYKTLLIILLFLLIPIVLFLRINQRGKEVSAEWFNDSWNYRQRVDITNSSGSDLTDFQVSIDIGTSALIAAGKMQSDCDDIRITDQNGNLLPYWIEENNPGCNQVTDTKIWVKTPSLPTSGAPVYIYYGNSSANSTQNGNEVFEFFDDFNSASLDTSKWTTITKGTGGTITQSSGNIVLSPTPNTISNVGILSKSTFTNNLAIEIRRKTDTNTAYMELSIGSSNVVDENGNQTNWWHTTLQNGYYFFEQHSSDGIYLMNGASKTAISSLGTTPIDFSAFTNHTFTLDDSGNLEWSIDGTSQYTATNNTYISTDKYVLVNQGEYTTGNGAPQSVDYLFVHKLTTVEPTATPQSEEVGGGPIAYWSLDEGVGTTAHDSAGNQNHGIVVNAIWQDESSCVSGKCIYLDGSGDYVSITDPANGSLDFDTRSFSISVWVKSVGQTSGQIITKSRYFIEMADGWGGKSYASISDGTNQCYRYANENNLNIYDGKWYHYVAVFDRTKSHPDVYLNGSLQNGGGSGTVMSSVSDISNSSNFVMGGYGGNFKGYIDEVKIYPYARTANQIKADYASGLAGMSSSSDSSVNIGGASSGKALSDGLVGYWKFDEGVGTTTVDSSGNNNLATFGTGDSAPSWASGVYGVGISFDGTNDYASTPLNGTTFSEYTYGLWYKTSSVTGTADIFNWSNSLTDGGAAFYIRRNGSTVDVYVAGAYSSSTPISINTWYRIDVTYKNQLTTININGEPKITFNRELTSLYKSHATNVFLGNNFNRNSNSTIDEVRLYNRALSPTEVKQLYEYAPGPVVHYKFENKSGTTVFDSSGGNYNLVMSTGNSAPTWTTGKYGSGLRFTGNNQSATGNITPNIVSKVITQSGWYKFDNLTGIQRLLSSNTQGYIQTGLSNNSIFIHSINSAGADYNIGNVTLPSNCQTGWHYLTIIRDSTLASNNVKAYCNGVQFTSGNFINGLNGIYTINYLEIGRASSDQSFNGYLDDFKIYNYARTQKQILEDMAGLPVGAPAKVGSPLAHYKFDEGFGTTVNNSGSAGIGQSLAFGTSAPSWSNSGKNNKALNFSGTGNYLIRSDNDTFELHTGGVSASAWVKIQNPLANHAILVSKGGSSVGAGGYWWGISTNGKMDIAISNGTNWLLPAYSLSNRTVTDNIWHHLAFTWDPTQALVNFYVDGQLDKSIGTTASTSDITGTTNLLVGGFSSPGFSQNGLIDEVKIYNYALSADEVKQDYNQGSTFVFGSSNQTIGATTTSLDYCLPGDTSPCSPPVAEWKFEEGVGTTAYDTSGNSNHGVFGTGNSAPSWSTGKIGKSLRFDGSDFVTTNTTLSNEITVEAWVFQTGVTSLQNIISGNGITNYVSIYNSKFQIYDGSGWKSTTTTVSPNKWYHLSFSFVNSTKELKMYVNGVLEYSATGLSSYSNGQVTRLGFHDSHSDRGLIGKLDNIRVYNYARTPAQIAYDYNKGAPVGHWKLDECQGTTIHDSSGNNNHGVLSIGASGTQTSPGTCTTSGTAWANGKLGKLNASINFDGSDDVISVPDHNSLNLREITISAWIKNNLSGHNYQRIVDKVYNSEYALYVHSGNIGVGLVTDLGSYDNAQVASNVITDTNWHNVVFTWTPTSGAIKIYVDGTLKGSASRSGNYINNSTNPVLIGNRAGNDRAFNGQIDDVRIYNYPLTATQVKTLYYNGAVTFR